MARLNAAPLRAAAQRETSSPATSYSNADNEAASQQLLDEIMASTSKKQAAQPSSAFGASLLNAARVGYRHSSPIRPGRKADSGKLRRVTFFAEQPRKDIARGEEVYNIPDESPEKGVSKLQGTVNHGPWEKVNRAAMQEEVQEPSSELPNLRLSGAFDAVDESHIASSPPELGGGQDNNEEEEPRPSSSRSRGRPSSGDGQANPEIKATLPTGEAQCSVFHYTPKNGPGYVQCRKAATTRDRFGPCCHTHMEKPATVRCGAAVKHNEELAQCKMIADPETGDEPRCKRHINKEAYVPGQERVHEQPAESPKATSKRAKTQKSTSSQKTAKRKSDENAANEPQIESPKRQKVTKPNSSGRSEVNSKGTPKKHVNVLPSETEELQVDIDDGEDEDDESEGTHGSDSAVDWLFRPIFKYTESGERSGACHTKAGIKIKSICDTATLVLEEEENLSVEQVAETTHDLRLALVWIEKLKEHRRPDFKSDAYNFIFHSLAVFVRAVYEWHSPKQDSIFESLDAMQALSPLLHDILSFKDTIANWRVKVPQRYQGDRVIKDVDINLIAHLRKADLELRKQLRVLEAKDKQRQYIDALIQRNKEEEAEAERLEEEQAQKKERWARWQELHVKRMQCEPDPFKRRKLKIVKLEEFEERDANGIRFDRIPMIGHRTSPPLYWPVSAQKKEWTDAEQTALIEGLREFTGPAVFHKIFEKYCRIDGVLRKFTVTNIVYKAAEVRSKWQVLHQEHGWEVPAWVERIPVLP